MDVKNWFSKCWQGKSGKSIALAGTLLFGGSESLLAQIVPDNTLGAESSVVIPNENIQGIQSDRIDNGATRGANLFHSFDQFNINAEKGAYFTNPPGVENIFSRVTGANPSEIGGRLGVLGNANLFLINPRGIVFGSGASLDVQGSFLATTGNAIKLGDTGLFSATQPEVSNLLTFSPSAILFNTIGAQPIVNRSQALSATGQPNAIGLAPGLQVQPERTLALVGGNILLEGGNLTAAQGRIELGSVTGVGQVNLVQSGNSFALEYNAIGAFGNIGLSNGAIVDASGAGGGDIQIRGERLEMTQGSNIFAATVGAEDGRGVRVRARDVFLRQGSSINANVADTGTGGDIKIDTERLLLEDGALISASTLDAGKGGSLQITATDSIEVRGVSANGQVPSGLFAVSDGSGDAGELRIDTQRLWVLGGAQVAVSNFGQGKGGSLQITATDSVEVSGATDNERFVSGVFAVSEGSGDAGNVRINTAQLRVQGGGQILVNTLGAGSGGSLQIMADSVKVMNTSASGEIRSVLSAQSEGDGDAGNVRIDTQRLRVQGGAQIGVGTFGAGNGGSLQITATDSIEVSGTTADGRGVTGLFTQSQGSGNAGDLTLDTRQLRVQGGAVVSASTFGQGKGGSLLIRATDSVELSGSTTVSTLSGLFTVSNGSGNAGDVLKIDTGQLRVQDGAVISSRSIGAGEAGNIDITVRDTLEVNNGTIQTNTSSSAGGAITIEANVIRLFDNSDITSSVTSGEDGGGTITLTADSILAFDDSDILAFARDGRGGDIILNTPAFFGENYRLAPRNTDPNTVNDNNRVDINATGAVSGIILTPDVSFIQNSLNDLPENQINTDRILANSCVVRREGRSRGSFTITGTGGFPQRPGDAQASSFPTVDVETIPGDSTPSNTSPNRPWQKGDPIIKPQGVYRLPNGKLILSRECA